MPVVGPDFLEAEVFDLGIFVVVGPKVISIDVAVGEPAGAVVGVVGFFAFDAFFHGEVAGDVTAGGAHERVDVGDLVTGVVGQDGFAVVGDGE